MKHAYLLKKRVKAGVIFFAVSAATQMTACSPAGLFGSGEDSGIKNNYSYRRVNPGCSKLDVSQSKLSTSGARQLTDCLNAQGALGNFGKLVKQIPDADLEPFVRGLNETVLNSPRRLAELERTFQDLEERKLLEPVFAGLGELLQNDELIARTLGLLQTAYAPQGKTLPDLQRAALKLSERARPASVSDLLDLAWNAADSRAFASSWSLMTHSPRVIGPEAARGLLEYVRSDSRILRQAIDYAVDGKLFGALDSLVPNDEPGLARSVPGWASLLDVSLADDSRIGRGLGSMMGALLQPIPCLQGTRVMDHIAMDFMDEIAAAPNSQLSATLQRSKLVQLWMSAPLCAFPKELALNYPSLLDLAASPAVEPMGDVIRSFHGAGLADFVLHALGDGKLPLLYPLLSEVTARGAWTDVLLLASVSDLSADRAGLQETLRFFTTPMEGSALSLYDVAVQGLARSDVNQLTEWLRALGRAKIEPREIARALGALREGYAVNDVHPLISLAQQSLHDAGSDAATLESLLRLTLRPDFRPAISELAAMAKDGRLKDLIKTTLDLFHGYALRGSLPIATLPTGQGAPAPVYNVRHHLDSSLLTFRLPAPAKLAACRELDLSAPWSDPALPGFESQWQTLAACVNADGAYRGLEESLRFLGTEKTDAGSSYHALLVRAYQAIQLTATDVSRLADWGLASLNDGRADRLLRGVSYWINHSLVAPLVDLARPLARDLEARAALKRLGAFGAQILRRPDFQPALRLTDDLIRATPATPVATTPDLERSRARLAQWIVSKECTLLPADGPARQQRIEERVNEITDEYLNAAVNHGPLVGGKLRRGWTFAEIKTEIAPVLAKFAHPKEEGPALGALLHFTARFADHEQYPVGYLEKWLRDRTAHHKVISYLYPGEKLPRVRYVNELDVLSIMVANADIYAGPPVDSNFGMQFLMNIADSWGDVPFEKRPAEIQAKFPKGKKCPTLLETAEDIIHTMEDEDGLFDLTGFPALPKCANTPIPNDPDWTPDPTGGPNLHPPADWKEEPELAGLQANLFNLKQTLPAVLDNAHNGGLRVIRDLFFDLLYSSPPEFRDGGAGLRNNLTLATRIVTWGALRQAGRQLEGTRTDTAQGKSITSFFELLAQSSAAPSMASVTDALFVKDPAQTLLWKVLEQVFGLETTADVDSAKRLGLYGLAAIHELNAYDPKHPLLDPSLQTLSQMLDQNREYLTTRVSAVRDFMTSRDVADFAQSLAQDRSRERKILASIFRDAVVDPAHGTDLLRLIASADGNEAGHRAWRQFVDRWDALDTSAEFQGLRLREIGRQMLDTLEARHPERPEDAATTRRLLDQLALQMELGNMETADQLVRLAGLKPDETNRLLASLAKLVDGGEAHSFLEVIRRNLTIPKP